MWSHAFPTHLVKTILCSDVGIFSSMYKVRLPLRCFSNWVLTASLKCLLTDTSNGWTRLVQPGGTFISSVLFLCKSCLTSSVCWARWTSATKILPDKLALGGFMNIFPHSPSTQTFMTFSSHHALGWNITFTLLSQLLFSLGEILFPCPRKMIVGLTRQTPSAKMVSCIVHWRLSKPDEAFEHQTSFVPFDS